ncbi:hypothetical protein LguiB_033694 [Lonicera macranthoides]
MCFTIADCSVYFYIDMFYNICLSLSPHSISTYTIADCSVCLSLSVEHLNLNCVDM